LRKGGRIHHQISNKKKGRIKDKRNGEGAKDKEPRRIKGRQLTRKREKEMREGKREGK